MHMGHSTMKKWTRNCLPAVFFNDEKKICEQLYDFSITLLISYSEYFMQVMF